MADDDKHYHLEVLGSCTTNPTPGSQHTQTVEARHLWSYAQEEALVAMSEQGSDGCWRLVTDPERRARRVAARYADLYFTSADKSQGQVQFHWPALAAFVVKDIVEAFRYAREEVLHGGAHRYVRQHVKDHDAGYRLPPSRYWPAFGEAFYVMEAEHRELGRIVGDVGAAAQVQKVAGFGVTPEIEKTYSMLITEFKATSNSEKLAWRKRELEEIAKQEQLNVLQPLIYDDAKLTKTMDVNHKASRYSHGFLSPRYKVVYSAAPKTDDPELQTVFDPPTGIWSYLTGPTKSFPNPVDRMEYVERIAKNFHDLMTERRAYMNAELQKLRGWLHA